MTPPTRMPPPGAPAATASSPGGRGPRGRPRRTLRVHTPPARAPNRRPTPRVAWPRGAAHPPVPQAGGRAGTAQGSLMRPCVRAGCPVFGHWRERGGAVAHPAPVLEPNQPARGAGERHRRGTGCRLVGRGHLVRLGQQEVRLLVEQLHDEVAPAVPGPGGDDLLARRTEIGTHLLLGGSLAIGLGLPCAPIVAMTAVQRESPSELLGRVAATAGTSTCRSDRHRRATCRLTAASGAQGRCGPRRPAAPESVRPGRPSAGSGGRRPLR